MCVRVNDNELPTRVCYSQLVEKNYFRYNSVATDDIHDRKGNQKPSFRIKVERSTLFACSGEMLKFFTSSYSCVCACARACARVCVVDDEQL